MKLKGTQTEKNLLIAFAGESQARNRYTYFASQARKEGYEQIAAIFEETANQEKEHAKREFKFLEGGDVEKIKTGVEKLKRTASKLGEIIYQKAQQQQGGQGGPQGEPGGQGGPGGGAEGGGKKPDDNVVDADFKVEDDKK